MMQSEIAHRCGDAGRELREAVIVRAVREQDEATPVRSVEPGRYVAGTPL